MIIGYAASKIKRPANLLEACLFWDGCQGGTIHQYYSRLSFKEPYCVNGNYIYILELDNMRDIGRAYYPKKQEPQLEHVLLDHIPATKDCKLYKW